MYSEIPASASDKRAWVAVFPFKGPAYGPRPDNESELPWRFRIRKFEVAKFFLDGNYDVHEEYLEKPEDHIADSKDSLRAVLERWPIDLTERANDYPI